MDYIKNLEERQLRDDKLDFRVGDTVEVDYKVKEGNRERIQVYDGTVVKIQGGGVNETFTVRRVAYGVGSERTFFTNSPRVEDVRVKRRGKARRSKLYYLRDRQGRAAKIKERQDY